MFSVLPTEYASKHYRIAASKPKITAEKGVSNKLTEDYMQPKELKKAFDQQSAKITPIDH